jgi:hypothetical protein
MVAERPNAGSTIVSNLPIQPNIIEVQGSCAAIGCWGALCADTNSNSVDVGEGNTKSRQVDYPLVPSSELRCGGIIMVDL